jgi:hypothetical protein
MWHVWGRRDMCIGVLVGKPVEKSPLEDLVVDGKMVLKWILKKCDVRTCTGIIWVRIATSGGFL